MNLDDPSWGASVFTKNRDRLVQHEVARQFFEEVVRQAKQASLVSADHFTVDGTLIEAWASLNRRHALARRSRSQQFDCEDRVYSHDGSHVPYSLGAVDLESPGMATVENIPADGRLIGFLAGCPVFYEGVRGAWRSCAGKGCRATP